MPWRLSAALHDATCPLPVADPENSLPMSLDLMTRALPFFSSLTVMPLEP